MNRSETQSCSSSTTSAVLKHEHLPAFSEKVKTSLKNEHLTKRDLGLILEEAAQLILACGDMTTKLEYQKFGQAMVKKYPSLDFSSPHSKEKPWVCADAIRFYVFFTCLLPSKCKMCISGRYYFIAI